MPSTIVINDELELYPISAVSADRVRALMQDCYVPAYKHYWQDEGQWYLQHSFCKEQVLSDLTIQGSSYWIVVCDKQEVGVLRTILDRPSPDEENGVGLKLERIYLRSNSQGKGIGKELFSFVERYAMQEGCAYIWLETMDQQTPAQQFYRKMGYQTTGTMVLGFELMNESMRGMIRMSKML